MAPSRKHKQIRKQKSKVKHYHKPSYKRKWSNKPYIWWKATISKQPTCFKCNQAGYYKIMKMKKKFKN
jgi:hypothetical protein